MIRTVEITHFQSLRQLKARLGWFTVVTGETGAGKSAFLRAVDMVRRNAASKSDITRGEKSCTVLITGDEVEHTGMDDDTWAVSIHRTVAGKGDNYQLRYTGGSGQPFAQTYTKLARKVPDEVTAVLRLADVNIARQLDMPYLLDNTGGEVARVLGKLTNVTLLYRAAQEGNRRKQAAERELKTRRGDLERLLGEAAQYENLAAQRVAVEAAEQHLSRAAYDQTRLDRLDQLIQMHNLAAHQIGQFRQIPEPPSLERLELLLTQRKRLDELVAAVGDARRAVVGASQYLSAMEDGEQDAQRALAAFSEQWQVCPACGQPVKREPHTH